MTSPNERWARVDALFADVLAKPAAERDAYLESTTSGDPELRAQVRALLASLGEVDARLSEVAEDLLPFNADALASSDLDALLNVAGLIAQDRSESSDGEIRELAAGTRLGPWVVVRELGRGGMGAVYLAERADAAFDRRVAIKVLQSERESAAWQRRFLAERRVLASLEHEKIARLYDTGTTDDGRPFLVMEYVEGMRLDVHADSRQLDVVARVRLVLGVCDAVSHAHQRLVVHRDLKPANVLVTANGDVKLLDFGIAALLDVDTGEPAITQSAGRLLTPDYASPEQARGDVVGAATDVYSLGVVLHELLTGVRPPWQRMVRQGAPLAALEQAIVLPSRTVVAQGSPSARASIASARRSTPDRLARQLAGDLDTILLTALAPEPMRRYASVEALRDDLERWLAHRPIGARRATLPHRARRFVQRNPALVAVGAGAAMLAVGFVTSLVVQSQRVAAQRDVAERERARAEQVAQFVTGLFEAADPFGALDPDTIRAGQLLDVGAERLDRELAARPAVQAEMQTVLGGIYYNLNRSEQARVLLERAAATRRADTRTAPLDLAMTLSRLGEVLRAESRFEPAEEAFREALTLQEHAGAAGAARLPLVLGDLGRLLNETNRFDSAQVLYDRALTLLRTRAQPDTQALAQLLSDRGWLASRMGEDSLALVLAQEALALQRASLGDAHPTTLVSVGNVAFLLDLLGRSDEAVPLHREAVAGLERRLGEAHGSVSTALVNLATALVRSGAADEAVTVAERAVAIDRRRIAGPHADLARKLSELASLQESAGRVAEAERVLAESYAMHVATLGAGDPGSAITLARLGGNRCRESAPSASRQRGLADLRRAVAVLDSVFPPAHPQRISRRLTLGVCLARIGQLDAAAELIGDMAMLAVREHPAASPIVGMTLRNWRAVQQQRGDSVALARVLQLADSLGVVLPR